MKISTIQTIKKLLKSCNYDWLADHKKAFYFFKKSNYFKSLEESVLQYPALKCWKELEEDCKRCAYNFSEDIRHLNLI